MKAISLWQPWASFIAIGVKPFETRDWSPPAWLIGKRIAIHAAKRVVNMDDRAWACRCGADELPLGAIVCTAILRGAYRVPTTEADFPQQVKGSPALAAIRIDEFGDYYPGRWAWHLTDIERFDPPILARGAQGFWNWTFPQEAGLGWRRERTHCPQGHPFDETNTYICASGARRCRACDRDRARKNRAKAGVYGSR